MLTSKARLVIVILLALFVSHWASPAGTTVIVGPGDVATDTNDGIGLCIIDTDHSQVLSAGQYQATLFNYQFGQYDQVPGGQVTPFLATKSGSVFTPIAVGTNCAVR